MKELIHDHDLMMITLSMSLAMLRAVPGHGMQEYFNLKTLQVLISTETVVNHTCTKTVYHFI